MLNVSREPRTVEHWFHDLVLLSLVWVSVDGNILQSIYKAQSIGNQAVLLHLTVNFLDLPV